MLFRTLQSWPTSVDGVGGRTRGSAESGVRVVVTYRFNSRRDDPREQSTHAGYAHRRDAPLHCQHKGEREKTTLLSQKTTRRES